MRLSIGRAFLLILLAGLLLMALIAAGDSELPGILLAVRILLGVVFVLLVPGFMLQTALFVHRTDLDLLTRAAFSFGLSIAVLPLIFLLINGLGYGIDFLSIAVAITLFILICGVVTLVRNRRLPETDRIAMPVPTDVRGWWASQDRISRGLYVILVLALSTATVSAILVSRENMGERFTEFFLLDSQGLSVDYPREVTAGQPVVFQLGIANREGEDSQYRIVAVQEEEKASAAVGPIVLADGEVWKGTVELELSQPGVGREVEFLLERVGSPWPYRTLRIWLNVVPPEDAARTEQTDIAYFSLWPPTAREG
jgi:uncharacterized membrane protein